MGNDSQHVVEEIKRYILCSVAVFRKSRRLWDGVEKYSRDRQATHDNVAHASTTLYT
jgi:hypothetical protein